MEPRPPCFLYVGYDEYAGFWYFQFHDKHKYVYPGVNLDLVEEWQRHSEPDGTFFNLNVRRPKPRNETYARANFNPDEVRHTLVDNR